ncbi:armadillo repeat-containing protein 10 isoform X5 [Ochotona curzoniae]|uniref:armadillo repeat-containing protein 10 isoform X5 n=1 Tax=Ochotona curzoniae TaxID=130825 RepID=UPI001B350202|nr:armadillo repeat-containing protein 10 isoform X5 [Ochotona curzoniae]
MSGARRASWLAAGLILGAGACYCVYRLTRGRRRGGRGLGPRPARSAEDLTSGSYDDVLNANQLQKLLYLLDSTDDPFITERVLVTLGNSAAFSVNQAIIRELGGIPIVGKKINSPNQSIKEKALNALNNLSVNVENQIKIKVDSAFLALFDSHVAAEILLRALTLFQNINNCVKAEGRQAAQPSFPQGSLFSLLYGEECVQKMRALGSHHDADVKEKAAAITPAF